MTLASLIRAGTISLVKSRTIPLQSSYISRQERQTWPVTSTMRLLMSGVPSWTVAAHEAARGRTRHSGSSQGQEFYWRAGVLSDARIAQARRRTALHREQAL